ncbi:MAG: hypothetical protein IJF80_01270 [Clostridia bacterium]|nr:hypothetical protein [Clostridia bacterium]
MFNNYMWQTYLNAGGSEIVKMFEENLTENLSKDYISTINKLRSVYCPMKSILDGTTLQLEDLVNDLQNSYLLEEQEYSIASALQTLYDGMSNNDILSPQDVFSQFSGFIEYYTTFLAIELPELFFPYYFQFNFNVLEKIAQEFDITLPPLPVKKDYIGRFSYYGLLCDSFFNFRNQHNLSPYELCAFLYDFAPKYIGGIDSYIIKDLPEPKSAFFIGGSKDDVFLKDNADTISCWQCNPDTRAGDMIVMYLRTPISAVDSVWRSVSIGFNDPFFYYYRCTYIANPVKIKQISQKQLQKDEIFKNIPIVRKNMQGINGVELKPSEYNHLMDLAKADVMRLEFDISSDNENLTNEKDVENNLIKPLLSKLGYTENEYVQQLYIEIGNHNHALIPDFVLKPVVTEGHHSAFAHIEAKYNIPNSKAMLEVKKQARSYAVQLKAKYSVIASKDKIWISKASDDFTEDIFIATWAELNNPDTFSTLLKLIGQQVR